MVELADIGRVAAAIATARDVEFSAYTLRPGGTIAHALEAAARNHGHVAVTLQATPYGDGVDGPRAAENARTAEALRAAGAEVRLVGEDEPPVHLKAAVADGVAFLDDRNWAEAGSPETIVATTEASDVAAVRSALAGSPAGNGHLETGKAAALGLEARLIASPGADRIDCESESFSYSRVLQALGARARGGAHVRLLVNGRLLAGGSRPEIAALDYLKRCGVEIRLTASTEKLCVAGDAAWVGSANASGGAPDSIDWGLRTEAPEITRSLAERFAANWARSRPYSQDGLSLGG